MFKFADVANNLVKKTAETHPAEVAIAKEDARRMRLREMEQPTAIDPWEKLDKPNSKPYAVSYDPLIMSCPMKDGESCDGAVHMRPRYLPLSGWSWAVFEWCPTQKLKWQMNKTNTESANQRALGKSRWRKSNEESDDS